MKRSAIHQQNPREQKYTTEEVQGWRKLMKDNNWRYKELSGHLGVGVSTIKRMLVKEAYGELRR